MFSIGHPSYHAINEEFLRACEYVANKSMAKAAIKVSANAHDLSLILTDAAFTNRKEVTNWLLQNISRELVFANKYIVFSMIILEFDGFSAKKKHVYKVVFWYLLRHKFEKRLKICLFSVFR